MIENFKIFYSERKKSPFSKLSTLPTSGTNLSAVGFGLLDQVNRTKQISRRIPPLYSGLLAVRQLL